MSLKAFVIRQYVNKDDIEHIIGHDVLLYVKTAIKYLALATIFLLIYRIVRLYVSPDLASLIFGVAGLLVYVFFVMGIFNNYFDAILITKRGIIILTWKWFLQYKTETVYRENIESITYQQDGLIDTVWNIGTIVIGLEHDISFPFPHVPQPKKQAALLELRKERTLIPREMEAEAHDTWSSRDEKFDILVETLGEVIVEYMKKKAE